MRGNVILTGEIKNICKSLIGKSERKKRPGTSKHIYLPSLTRRQNTQEHHKNLPQQNDKW